MTHDVDHLPVDAHSQIRHADSEADLHACWPVMRQLRPRLGSADEFVGRVRSMQRHDYRLLAAWQGAEVVALAGYHVMDNFIHDRFLYIDDLVTLEGARGERWGERLIQATRRIAVDAGCASLVLDTALGNALAQRFYFRQGLLTVAMRFIQPIDGTTA